MNPATLLAMIGGALIGKFTTNTLLMVAVVVMSFWIYKEFIWTKVKGG